MIVPGEIINGYKINNVIGGGAFSKVYSASKDSCDVCIKIQKDDPLSSEAAADEIAFFKKLEELQLTTPSPIITMIDSFTHGESTKCIVLPLYECNVQKFMSKNYPNGLPWALANKIIKQVLLACEMLHKNGIIHTDIKPENILLRNTKNIDEIEIALTDFGTVKPISNDYSDKIGTPEFQAPECIIGYPYNEKVDTWAIACTYYELLTGKYLFDPTGYNDESDTESDDELNDNDSWKTESNSVTSNASGVSGTSNSSDESSSNNDDDDGIFNLIHLYHMDRLLGRLPIEMTTEAHYSGYYFTRKNGLLGNLYQQPFSIRELVGETVSLDQSLKNRIVDFLQKALVYDPAKRASASDLLQSKVFNPVQENVKKNNASINHSLKSKGKGKMFQKK